MEDLSDHPHAIFMAGESYVSPSERAWLAWCKAVERLLGHDLDGNDERETGVGYSLDEAHACWEAGDSPQSYAQEVRDRPRYQKRSA